MPNDVENVSSDVLEDEVIVTEDDKTPEELEKLPLHLHERGKELVAEKNEAKAALKAWQALGDPSVIGERLQRLAMWEAAQEAQVEEKPAKTYSQDELTEKSKRDYARQVLEDLAPEIKEIEKLKAEVKEARDLSLAFKVATEDVAWETTLEIAEEIGMEPDGLASLTIPVIKATPKLARLYHSGKSDEAVRGAVKQLRSKLSKESSDIDKRAEQITKASETKQKVPKTHAPGKSDVTVKEDDKPKDFKESERRMFKRLEGQGF